MHKCRACHGHSTIEQKRAKHIIRLCFTCGSISIDKHNERFLAYNDKYYQTYYQTRDDENYRDCQILINDCKTEIKENILDFGAGSGVLAQTLMDEGFGQVFTYDKSTAARAFMRQRFSNPEIVLDTTENLNHKFNTIFMTDVISHIDDVDTVLTHLKNDLTESNGSLKIRTPLFSKIQNYILFILSWLTSGKFDSIILFTSTRFCLFTLHGIIQCSERNNFLNVQISKKNKRAFNPGKTNFKKIVFEFYYSLMSLIVRQNQLILIARRDSNFQK